MQIINWKWLPIKTTKRSFLDKNIPPQCGSSKRWDLCKYTEERLESSLVVSISHPLSHKMFAHSSISRKFPEWGSRSSIHGRLPIVFYPRKVVHIGPCEAKQARKLRSCWRTRGWEADGVELGDEFFGDVEREWWEVVAIRAWAVDSTNIEAGQKEMDEENMIWIIAQY